MAQRLTPTAARSIVGQRTQAQEEAARAERLAAAEKAAANSRAAREKAVADRRAAKEKAKEEAAWIAQGEELIRSAAQGEFETKFSRRLVRPVEILKLGFQIIGETDRKSKIVWTKHKPLDSWDIYNIISARALAWISSSGQDLLREIELQVKAAADNMDSSLVISLKYTNKCGHVLSPKYNEAVISCPPADQLSSIFLAIGWVPSVTKYSNDDYCLRLHW